MKFLFDFFPIILFFVAYKVAGSNPEQAAALATSVGYAADPKQLPILIATAVAILATFIQIGWMLMRGHKVDKMLWASLVIIVVFGGASLAFHDETFIKWKPTVLYWLFATVLLASALLFKKNLIRAMMQHQISMPDIAWSRLNLSWIGFFALMGALNLYIAFNFSNDAWVNFKLFGGLGLMLAFVVVQSIMLSKYIEKQDAS